MFLAEILGKAQQFVTHPRANLAEMIASSEVEQTQTGSQIYSKKGSGEHKFVISKRAMEMCQTEADLIAMLDMLRAPTLILSRHFSMPNGRYHRGNFAVVTHDHFRPSSGESLEVAIKRFDGHKRMDLTGFEQFTMLDLLGQDGFNVVTPLVATRTRLMMQWFEGPTVSNDDPGFKRLESDLWAAYNIYRNKGLLRSGLGIDPYAHNYPLRPGNHESVRDQFMVRDMLVTANMLQDINDYTD